MSPVDGDRLSTPRRSGFLGQTITYGLFPVTFFGMLSVAFYGLEQAWAPGWILAGISISTASLVALVERLHPEYPAWNRGRGDVGTDGLHTLVSIVLLPELLKLALPVLLLSVATSLNERVGFQLWPAHWPILLQLPLAMVVSQFAEYWLHRCMHESPLLWRLHATHHSPQRLYWLNAGRFHPVDASLSFVGATAPLLLLGVANDVLVLYSVWVSVHGIFQHCNVHLRLGPLNYVFSMAELHRWHHSLVLEEANANYGNNIIFWDLVFGTFFYPRDRDAAEEIGLSDLPAFPEDYLGQLFSPLRWKNISAPPPDGAEGAP